MLVGIYVVASLFCHLFSLLYLSSTCIPFLSCLPYLFDPKDGCANLSEGPEDTDGVASPGWGLRRVVWTWEKAIFVVSTCQGHYVF